MKREVMTMNAYNDDASIGDEVLNMMKMRRLMVTMVKMANMKVFYRILFNDVADSNTAATGITGPPFGFTPSWHRSSRNILCLPIVA